MIVMKFGGTSVQDAKAITRVVGILRNKIYEKPLVVVSAMSKVTKQLCALAQYAQLQNERECEKNLQALRERHIAVATELLKADESLFQQTIYLIEERLKQLEQFVKGVAQIGELSPRSEAKIVSNGELLSSIIVAAAFNANGLKCKWLDARQMLVTDENHLSAKVEEELSKINIQRIVNQEIKGQDLLLTQGFIASSIQGHTSLLGFEGSDYSAALFAASLSANRIEIWTDVDGVRTADPRKVENTCKVEKLSYEEAAEMASLGARVLHPLTMEPAKVKNIPIYVLNSINPEGTGSVVMDKSESGCKSIAYRDDIDYVEITSKSPMGINQLLWEVTSIFKEYNIELALVSFANSKLVVTMEKSLPGAKDALDKIGEKFDLKCSRDKVQISIIGKELLKKSSLLEEIMNLAKNCDLKTYSANALSISLITDEEKGLVLLKNLHKIIFE